MPHCVFYCSTSGCTLLLGTALGINFLADIEDIETLEKRAKRKKLAEHQVFYLSSFDFFPFLKAIKHQELQLLADKEYPELEHARQEKRIKQRFHDLYQPVQIHIFDRAGGPLFKMLNCHLDPVIPMRWNRFGSFDEFPPSPLNIRGFDIELYDSLQFFVPFFRNRAGSHVNFNDLPSADYYVMVFWNDYYKRPSRKLLRKLRKSFMKLKDKNIAFLFVNNHNAFVWNNFRVQAQQKRIKESRAPLF